MNNRTTAFAIALMMALSGFTVLATASDDAEAAEIAEPEVGDAWGIGGTMTLLDLIEFVNDNSEYKLDKQELLDYLSMYIGYETGTDAEISQLDLSIELWEITELAEHTSSGYTLNLDLAAKIAAEVSMTATGELPGDIEDIPFGPIISGPADGEDEEEQGPVSTLRIENTKLAGDVVMHAKVYLNNSKEITGMSATVNAQASNILNSNINVDEDGAITYTDEIKSQTFTMGIDAAMSAKFIEDPMQVVPADGQESWKQEMPMNLSVVGNYYVNTPFEDLNFSEGFNESDTDDIYIAFDSHWETVDGVSVLHVVPQEDSDIDFGYTYPFEYDPDYVDAPDILKIGDSVKLSAESKKAVLDSIKRIDDEREDINTGTEFTVTFLDDDDNPIDSLTVTVKYGEKIRLPDYPADAPHDADEVFIGWEYGDVIWNDAYPVKSNMVLEAEFADVTDQMPGEDDFLKNPSVKWDSDVDDIVDKIVDNGIFTEGNTLYISVEDANGNVLYKWRIADSSVGGVSSETVIMPEIQKKETPDKVYLKEASEGKQVVYLDFKASGVMPNHTVVSYYVGDVFENGDTVTIYYDNETAGSAEHSGSAVVVDGFVDIPLKHCSSYMLVSDGKSASDSNTLMLVAIGFAALVVVIAAVYVFVRNKKNAE